MYTSPRGKRKRVAHNERVIFRESAINRDVMRVALNPFVRIRQAKQKKVTRQSTHNFITVARPKCTTLHTQADTRTARTTHQLQAYAQYTFLPAQSA